MSDTANSETKTTTIPSEALMQLLAPDGYYLYLNVEKPASADKEIDVDQIKKNYRKLSLKHHPDRRGGDEETFRASNRAQRVLLHGKLRQQYDLLGLDLEEDEDHHDEHQEKQETDEKKDADGPPPTPDTIVSHMASAALAGVLQAVVRTAMLGFVAVLLVRYRITLIPTILVLAYTAFRIQRTQGSSLKDILSPVVIVLGLVLMYFGRSLPDITWTFVFWIGEALVATMFTYNSLVTQSPVAFAAIVAAASVLTLWTRGDLWKYITLLALELLLTILLALLFPIMEMLLEAILNEKLRKVGDKVRAQNARMQAYYNAKQKVSL